MSRAAKALARRPAVPIRQRIEAALALSSDYYVVLGLVFPPGDYPRAYNYQQNGGPPGCAMAFNAALRKMGYAALRLPDGRRPIVKMTV